MSILNVFTSILIFLFFISPSFAESTSIGSGLYPHKGIYGTFRVDDSDDSRGQIKLQAGFSYEVKYNFHFSYSAKSLWDIQESSGPFRDINHNPEFYWKNKTEWFSLDYYTLGYEHESNGVNNESVGPNGRVNRSRSIHNINIQPHFMYSLNSGYFLFYPKLWWNFKEDENDDIGDFYGNLDLQASYLTSCDDHNNYDLSGKLRGNVNTGKGRIELELSRKSPWFDFFIFFQVFSGYGESLLDYNKKDTSVRIGIMLSRYHSKPTICI